MCTYCIRSIFLCKMFFIIILPVTLCPWVSRSHKFWPGRFMLDLRKVFGVVKLRVRPHRDGRSH